MPGASEGIGVPARREKVAMKTAADVMTRQIIDIAAHATVSEAIERMKERNVSSLLVKPDSGIDTWGFMSETDVIEKVVAEGLDPVEVLVSDIMSRPVITVSPKHSLQECAALFARANIRRVLVFDGEEMVGIVSSSDIFKAL
jgi:isocitrate dehydrogenase